MHTNDVKFIMQEILGLVERIMKVVRAPHLQISENYIIPSDVRMCFMPYHSHFLPSL